MTELPLSAVARVLNSAAALQHSDTAAADTVRVESPLPGGAATVVRFLLNTVPSWLQIAGAVLAVIAGFILVVLLVRRRRAIRDWFVARPQPVKTGLMVGAAVVVTATAGFGAVTWNYTQHSNAFCTGCHVMNPAFDRMANGESEHSKLSCHDCHQQSIFASARQLYVWVAERPGEIGEHAKLPNRVCETCHVTGDTATWQRIASTAGHRVHLESDSSTLNNLQCVECHGVEAHRFNPVNKTCGQSECHDPKDTEVVLGKMAGQTVRHCTSCHEFTAEVPALATADSARTMLRPGSGQCLACHEMRVMLADFDASKDPHGGKCGSCHNPHEQETPRAAANTCANAGCHSNWEEEPFHTGLHRRVASECLTCHMPHSASVDASGCQDCHQRVRQRGRFQPPVRFDTTRALQRTQLPRPQPEPFRPHSSFARAGSPAITPHAWAVRIILAKIELFARQIVAPARPPARPRPPPDSVQSGVAPPDRTPGRDGFTHARHARLACLVCHETGEGHGRLTFQRPRGCSICHHQAPSQSRCASCHRTAEYSAPQPATVTVTVPGRESRPRPVDFLHTPHLARPCLECHTTPVTLAPPPAKAMCRDCHADHHAVSRNCSACHASADPAAAHTLESAHQRCDACHTATTIARLTPTRAFCATCHTAKATGHYDNRECTACHFLAEPAAYQPRLRTGSRE